MDTPPPEVCAAVAAGTRAFLCIDPVRLTSKTKAWRSAWEVPVHDRSYAVCADLFATPAGDMAAKAPRGNRPASLTPSELTEIARVVEAALVL